MSTKNRVRKAVWNPRECSPKYVGIRRPKFESATVNWFCDLEKVTKNFLGLKFLISKMGPVENQRKMIASYWLWLHCLSPFR